MIYFSALLLCSLGASLAGPLLLPGGYDLPSAAAGAGAAGINGLAFFAINRLARMGSPARFLAWSLLGNGFRILVLILLIYVVYHRTSLQFSVFTAGTLAGYFTFLFGEVWGLHRASMKDTNGR